MDERAYERTPLNPAAQLLTQAQTDIKIEIKNGVLAGAPFSVTRTAILKIIGKTVAKISSETLAKDARASLLKFADREYKRFKAEIRTPPALIAAVVLLMKDISRCLRGDYTPKGSSQRNAAEVLREKTGIDLKSHGCGLPLQEFHKTYIRRVSKALDGLAEARALDPNDFTGRNSLRNLAEMQVRYERHLDEIVELKASGNRLVVCSVHADCSERCKPFQGRVYSLDGTSGTTADGRKYMPLEVATDIYYTTKAGRTYKNGLLGFNCRHRLLPYRAGMLVPKVSSDEQKREYEITKTQREMERSIVKLRETSLLNKDVDENKYREYKQKVARLYENYKAYSRRNGRAYYPDRVKIL